MKEAIKMAIEGGYRKVVPRDTTFSLGWNYAYGEVIWKNRFGDIHRQDVSYYLLDPAFWQALGRAMGWEEKVCRKCGMDIAWKRLPEGEKNYCDYCRTPSGSRTHVEEWLYHWHRFIDSLADGNTTYDFFKELLANGK